MTSVMVTAAALLRPILATGYVGDDVANSQIPMQMGFFGRGIFDQIGLYIAYWRDGFGRFFPGSNIETVLVFVLLPGRLEYKVFQVLMVVVTIAVFVAFVGVLTADVWLGVVAGFLVIACLQMRDFHDALYQFNAQQPTALALILGTMLALLVGLRQGSVRWLVLAVLLWTASLLTYETSYLLSPLLALVAVGSNASSKRCAGWLSALALPTIGLMLYVAHIRAGVGRQPPAYTLNLDLGPVFTTFVRQASAALPLSYAIFNPPAAVHGPARLWAFDGVSDIAAAVLTLVALPVAVWRMRAVTARIGAVMALAGLLLIAAPSLVVAVTLRWQQELVLGTGYVSVFVGYFGVALVLIAALGAVMGWARRATWLRPTIAVATTAAVLICSQVTADNNGRVLAMRESLRNDRELFEDSIRADLFGRPRSRELVLSVDKSTWVNEPFVVWYGGPRLELTFDVGASRPDEVFVSKSTDRRSGVAALGVVPPTWDPKLVTASSSLRAFLWRDQAACFAADGRLEASGISGESVSLSAGDGAISIVSRGASGTLVAVRPLVPVLIDTLRCLRSRSA